MNEEEIFHEALARNPPEERAAYLDRACADHPGLRTAVEALLRANVGASGFLNSPMAPLAEAPAGSPVTKAEDLDTDGADASLDFLAPSEKPDSLGRVGHYEILEVIGRGGMGVVLRALDEKLHRVVAIKVMAAQLASNGTARKRFMRKAQAAAAVSHDHIVTIHAVEEAAGHPYLVMQYISGTSLQERLDRTGPLQLAEIVRIGMQTASALAAAHAQGVVHRDIKPANILLENGIERVKVTDFGLARAVTDASLTQSGVVAGTPQFMSPEQARGEVVDQRTDLFSLGSVLYAMCTGRAPFRASGSMAVLKRVCEETPTPIRESNPDIPDWLVALIDKLHAKDPAGRCQTAAEVAAVLNQHLAHLQHPSVVPLPAAAAKSQRRQYRRWAAAAVALLCLVAGFALMEAIGVTSVRTTVMEILQPNGKEASAINDGAKPGNGGTTPSLDFPVGEVRKHDWPGRKGYFACFSPDGKYYAATGVGAEDPDTVRVWELVSGKLVMETNGNNCAVFTPDSKRLIAPGSDKQIHVWDLTTRQEVAHFGEHPDWVRLASLSADGKQLVTGCNDGVVRLWDVASGKEINRLDGEGKIGNPFLTPDGKQVVLLDQDRTIRLWDPVQSKQTHCWEAADSTRWWYMALTRGGLEFITVGKDAVYFWNMDSEKPTHVLRLAGKVFAAGISPDGTRLVYLVEHDAEVRLLDLTRNKEITTFKIPKWGATVPGGLMAFSPDGRFAVAASWAGVVYLWRLPDAPETAKK